MANVAKLLMLQGGKCFYCRKKLPLDEATIDHVIPKALGGDNTEANTVACCHSINHAFGNATPKEKMLAIINADGRLDCPQKPIQKTVVEVGASAPLPAAQSKQETQSSQPTNKKQPSPKPSPAKKPSSLRKHMQEAFIAAASINGGDKAMLTAVSIELRKRVANFKVKEYGQKTFANLLKGMGYSVTKEWCKPPRA